MSKVPHIANLRVRANRLGYLITKGADASVTGYSEYVLHLPNEDWENLPMLSLHGIASNIRDLEADAGIDEFGLAYSATNPPVLGMIQTDYGIARAEVRAEFINVSEAAIDAEMKARGWDLATAKEFETIGDNTDLTPADIAASQHASEPDEYDPEGNPIGSNGAPWAGKEIERRAFVPAPAKPAKPARLIAFDGAYRIIDGMRISELFESNGIGLAGVSMAQALATADAIRAYVPEPTSGSVMGIPAGMPPLLNEDSQSSETASQPASVPVARFSVTLNTKDLLDWDAIEIGPWPINRNADDLIAAALTWVNEASGLGHEIKADEISSFVITGVMTK